MSETQEEADRLFDWGDDHKRLFDQSASEPRWVHAEDIRPYLLDAKMTAQVAIEHAGRGETVEPWVKEDARSAVVLYAFSVALFVRWLFQPLGYR